MHLVALSNCLAQARDRFVVDAARLSPCRLDVDAVLSSLVRGQVSNGLLRPELLSGVTSCANLLVDRVVRLVSGSETGANLGASGVLTGAGRALLGVWGFHDSLMSSTSVGGSSSAWSPVRAGNSSRGLTEVRMSPRSKPSPDASCSSG